MKCLIINSLIILLFFETVQTQTEVWRVSGRYNLAAQDNSGNTYIAKMYPEDAEIVSLMKLSPTGEIQWTTSVPIREFGMLLTATGFYLSPLYDGNDPISFYNTDGILQWTYSLPVGTSLIDFAETDASGNILIAYSTPVNLERPYPLASTLLKLNSSGETVFEVAVPIVAPNAYEQHLLGPAVTSNDNIWIVVQSRNEIERNTANSSSYRSFAYDDAMLFHGTTGQLLLRKNIFRGLVDESTQDSRGNEKSYALNNASHGGPTKFIMSSGDYLVAGGFSDIDMEQCRSNGVCKSTQKSEWRMVIVDPTGKTTDFRYRGKGEVRGISGRSHYKNDGNGNELKEIFVGNDGMLYLHGTVSRGKIINAIGDLIYDDILMKYNIITKKIQWKIVTPYTSGQNVYDAYLYEPSQNILRHKNSYQMDVYNTSGEILSTPLSFPYGIVLPHQTWGNYFISNNEHNSIILQGFDHTTFPAQPYIAKYSIAGLLNNQTYIDRTSAYEADVPGQFSLAQNYPNPFNPSTTIEFELAANAIVTVKVYNTLGQEVATLADKEEFFEGVNNLEFDAAGLPSGVYYYRIATEALDDEPAQFVDMKKMVLIK